jgi:hypothetical protein
MYINKLLSKYSAVIAGDTEFANKLIIPPTFCNYQEYKKIICEKTFVLVQLKKYGEKTRIFEHPDMGLNLIPSWEGNTVLTSLLNLNSVETPKNKLVKQFPIAYFFYFSAFDVFGLFRDKATQIKIAKELLGGRLLREKSFPNCLRTGQFIEVVNERGKLEIQEISIKLFDAKGYTPAGAKGFKGTLDTWGVKFTNKDWLKYIDITRFDEEYADTKTLVNIAAPGEMPNYVSKHEITKSYAYGDGLDEVFTLYENIHNAVQNIANRLKLNNPIKNFQTIGNASNQIGVGVISMRMNMDIDKFSQFKLAQYLYPGSAYALLDGYHNSIKELLNIDGGYCKNLKPCNPIIRDLASDMDLHSAYNRTMKSLPYAVGVPCVYSFPKDRSYRPNFFNEYNKLVKKDMLYPNAWVARVTTTKELSFKQDLIFSKIFGATDFEKSLIDDGDGFFIVDDNVINEITDKKILAEIPDGSFQLLNNKIISGIMTQDIFQFITIYWTKAEQLELWENLTIDSMIFYNKNYLRDAEVFKQEFEKLDNGIHHSFDNGISNIKDNRNPVWTIIETDEGWFGTLQTIRDEMKNEAKLAFSNKEFEKSIQLNAGQNGSKNINNSSFGVAGSPFYQTEKATLSVKENGDEAFYGIPKMGNIVFAQNITARVRLAAYCMAKSLNGHPVITDGTPFNLNQVWSWNWTGHNRTSFGSDFLWKLSRYNTSRKVDTNSMFEVELKPLGGKQWVVTNLDLENELVTISNGETIFTGGEENWNGLDEMAYNHAKYLFGKLDIFKNDVMRYSSKNLYKGAAFQSQANYVFERFFHTKKNLLDNTTSFSTKARGYNLSKLAYQFPNLEDEGAIHPYTKMLTDIYESDIADVYIESVFSPELLGVGEFNKSENVTKDYIERGFLPHAPTFRSSKPSPFSLSMFRWNTRKQYEQWDKKIESWKRKTGFGIELLFLTPEMVKSRTPLKYTETINKIQNLIDMNTKPNSFDERIRKKFGLVVHPQLVKEKLIVVENESKTA